MGPRGLNRGGWRGISIGVIGGLGMVALCPLFAVPALWDAPSPILINLYATNQGANGKLIRQLR